MSKLSNTQLYKMSGAGNDFVVLDGRGVDVGEFRVASRISELCAEFRTDGLMILDAAQPEELQADFRMEFYNPDGSGGMMCGNGGRCIVAFADWLGVAPSAPDHYHFLAPDGPHDAVILARPTAGRMAAPGGTPLPSVAPAPPNVSCVISDHLSPAGLSQWTVKLGMIDVDGVREVLGGYFLNTGTRHFVRFVEDVDAVDIEREGKELRWRGEFAPEGTNVNFVQRLPDGTLKIRTFEKGVEGETLACGTGITASAIAAWFAFPDANRKGRISIRLQARRGDWLEVDFCQVGAESFRDIHLTGPAEFCKI